MTTKTRTVGVIMDPIGSITPKKDSSLAMLLEATRREYDIVYFEQGDLSIRAGAPEGRGHRLVVEDDPERWYELGEPVDVNLGDLDIILMRKDPPFDMEYIYTTYILDRAALNGALVVNAPAALRNINEKAYTAWFPDLTPLTLITRSMDQMRAFLRQNGRTVVKPLHGMGGKSIFVLEDGDNNANVVFETLTNYGTQFAMTQTFIPEISEGDKRILLIDGEPVPYALARIPPADDYRGNLVVGATGRAQPLSPRDVEIAGRIGPILREQGVIFAGIDVIGVYLTEVNVTSPTGIRELDRGFDLNIAGLMFDAIDARLLARE